VRPTCLAMLILSGLTNTVARAERPQSLKTSDSDEYVRHSPSFRVETSEELRPASSPFIAAIRISPAATMGIGRFYVQPRRRLAAQDLPISLEARKARRAAVGLSLRF